MSRPLAHWEALNGLPLATLNALRTRLLSEQPHLTFMALPKEVAQSGPDAALSALEGLDSPAMSDFWRIATGAAMVSEILCREAGRSLRQLNADEVGALLNENLDLLGRLDPIASKDGKSAPNLLNSCRQPHLLKGMLVTHVANHRIKNPELPWRKMWVIMPSTCWPVGASALPGRWCGDWWPCRTHRGGSYRKAARSPSSPRAARR